MLTVKKVDRAVSYMQPRLGYFSIAVLNNMRALILILLSCCICFEFINGANAPFAPTNAKCTLSTSSKSAKSDLFTQVKDTKSTMLDLKGGKQNFILF